MRSDWRIAPVAGILVGANILVFTLLLTFYAFSIILSPAMKIMFFVFLSLILQLAVYLNIASLFRKKYAYALLSIPLYPIPAMTAALVKGTTANEVVILYIINLVIGSAASLYLGLRYKERRR
ncbi:MAG: hypothetical protein OEV79_12090 [candidate division WOR-3 bacterium]|nr:hypothetical protein [candidate division WOR-3 bacterium]